MDTDYTIYGNRRKERLEICPLKTRSFPRFFDILSFAAGALFEHQRCEFAGGGKNQRMSKNRGNERVFRGDTCLFSWRLLPP